MDDQRIERERGSRIVARVVLWLTPVLFAANTLFTYGVENRRVLTITSVVLDFLLILVVGVEISWRRKK
jgi:hypothetical protein